ncbi:CLUMA_CG003501, isoform A [Clunio marinus]|uniref:CLUMA_CG003501, isoform A n=1 Tax=Clunio marinus TaxID=568069 RepID=A0A1J1HPF4_9DIPT|nr:CLUMA_CG003501, isoform A [Clunio marinus]
MKSNREVDGWLIKALVKEQEEEEEEENLFASRPMVRKSLRCVFKMPQPFHPNKCSRHANRQSLDSKIYFKNSSCIFSSKRKLFPFQACDLMLLWYAQQQTADEQKS